MPQILGVCIPENNGRFNGFPMKNTTIALLVAAGESRRIGGDIPKQYRLLAGKTVLRHSIEAFLSHPGIDGVCVVIHPNHRQEYEASTQGLKLITPAQGGATRQESVKNGLTHIKQLLSPTRVLIHDAARCLITKEVISNVLNGLENEKAVLPVIAMSDTIKQTQHSHVIATPSRENMVSAQTPQGFDFETIYTLHTQAIHASATDDASLAEHACVSVLCVPGSKTNIKLTTEEDFMIANTLLAGAFEYRTGLGYDVHKLVPYDSSTPKEKQIIWLCGVAIHHTHYLEGHSDADVGLHALVDAMLGTISAGDIGQHFPPSDPQWKGANSSQFATYAAGLLKQHNASLTHVDITLICEAPKISPLRDHMRKHLADLLKLGIDSISIKATTTEGLGFTGRKEGIAAQAVVTICKAKA